MKTKTHIGREWEERIYAGYPSEVISFAFEQRTLINRLLATDRAKDYKIVRITPQVEMESQTG